MLAENMLLAAMVANALYRQGKISFVTTEDRQKSSSLWQKKMTDGSPMILEGYDCQSSTIFIDPTLSPFNLGASFHAAFFQKSLHYKPFISREYDLISNKIPKVEMDLRSTRAQLSPH